MMKPGRAPDYRDRDYAPKRSRAETAMTVSQWETRDRAALAPKTLFEKYERIMQDSFRSLSEAVAVILSKHLYRQVGFDNFADCCEKRWGFSRAHGYRLAGANATLKTLPKSVTQWVTNERQARALAEVPEADRPRVLKQAIAAGSVTAKAIHAAADQVIDVEPEAKQETKSVKHCPTCTCE